MPSFMISLLAWGSDSSSLLNHLKDLKGHHDPLPDFAVDYQQACHQLDIVAGMLNMTWLPFGDPMKYQRDIEVANELELAAALDLHQRSAWDGSPMYFLGGDEQQWEIVAMDEDLQKRWTAICSDHGVYFEACMVHMEPRPFPAEYLTKFEEVSNELLAYEMYQSLLNLEVVEVNSVDQLTFLIRLREKEPNWEFQLSIADETERQAIEEMAEENNIIVRSD